VKIYGFIINEKNKNPKELAVNPKSVFKSKFLVEKTIFIQNIKVLSASGSIPVLSRIVVDKLWKSQTL